MWWWGSAGVVAGGVGLPRAACLGGDAFCAVGCVVEHCCDDGCWCLEQQFADGAGSGVEVGDAEVVQAEPDAGGVDGLSGAAAGEEELAVGVGGGGEVGAAGQVVGDVGGEGLRDGDWWVAEPDQELVAVVGDVGQGEANDPWEWLGVEEDE